MNTLVLQVHKFNSECQLRGRLRDDQKARQRRVLSSTAQVGVSSRSGRDEGSRSPCHVALLVGP